MTEKKAFYRLNQKNQIDNKITFLTVKLKYILIKVLFKKLLEKYMRNNCKVTR